LSLSSFLSYDEIQQFVPKTFYKLVPMIDLLGTSAKLSWERGREFNKNVANKLLAELESEQYAMYTI